MLSRRLPGLGAANAWTQRLEALRAARTRVHDLTEANPTRTGLGPLAEAAAALARTGPLTWEPSPLGLLPARAAVAASLVRPGAETSPGDIVLTASTSEAYGLLFKLLANPGEAVLAPTPSYPLFEPLARAEGIEVRPYRLAFDGAWHLDRASLEAALPGAKAVIVVEPNHPTGSCLDAADRAHLEGAAVRHGAAIIADEVFGDFPLPPHAGPLPTWRGDRAALTFVLGGLAKRCGLPHLKLGWIALAGPAAARAEALAGLEWLADLSLSVAAPVQAALPELLELRHAFAARVHARTAAHLAALDALVRARPELSRLPAQGGWSAVLRLPATRTDEAWAMALLERGVAAHPGHFYDLAPGEHLVVSLVADPAAFSAGLDALRALLAEV